MSSGSGSPPDRVGHPSAEGDEGTFEPTRSGGQLLLRTPVEFRHGHLLADRYQIERLVGNGASGSVFQAFDRAVRQVIAVKILKPELSADVRWVERLGTELRHARRLQHPNVCRVFDLGQADRHWFLTMEFASQGSLRQRLRGAAGAARPFETRVAEARAVIAGLAAIHASGIIHRDVKPENVLCMEDGRLVLSDFGLAVAPDQATYYSEMAGTPSYMAPEIAIGDKASTASDVWSLGVMLHEILFGKRPEWEVAGGKRKLKSPIGRNATKVERALAGVVGDCLADQGQRRLKDAGEAKESFACALRGKRPTRPSHRYVWWAAAAAAAVLPVLLAPRLMRRSRATATKATVPLLMGTAADWSKAPVLLTSTRPIACLALLPGGSEFRVVWEGPPREAIDYTVATGSSRAAPLLPETFQHGCPDVAADGNAVLFVRRDRQGASQVVLSKRADGGDAEPMTQGSGPVWMPNGREFVYAFDQRRAATYVLGGTLSLMPETPPKDKRLRAIAMNHSGTRIALASRELGKGGLLEIFEYPGAALLRAVALPPEFNAPSFRQPSDQLFLSVADGLFAQAALVHEDGRIQRVGQVNGRHVQHVLQTNTGRLLVTTWRNDRVATLRSANGTLVDVTPSEPYGKLDASEDGTIVYQRLLPDRRSVIAYRPTRGAAPVTISAGPRDMSPQFARDGRTFAFVRAATRTIAMCQIVTGAPSCRDVLTESGQVNNAFPSPSGRRLVYELQYGSSSRMRAVSRTGADGVDLGPDPGPCRPYWETDDLLWTFDAPAAAWVRRQLPSGTVTETRAVVQSGATATACGGPPSGAEPSKRVRVDERYSVDVRLVPL